ECCRGPGMCAERIGGLQTPEGVLACVWAAAASPGLAAHAWILNFLLKNLQSPCFRSAEPIRYSCR
ncbi:hypothetical protein XENOCAPTIV_011544, partial [Xenoophorus captivus]